MIFAQNNKGFALYLLPENIKSEELSNLDIKKIKPAGKPFISINDISTYLKNTHEFVLHYEETKRLRKLKVPVSGTPFIVFVGDEPIYTGAFWNGFSSVSFKGVVIDVSNLVGDFPTLKLELDYPPLATKNISFDPRPDQRIFNDLKKNDRLYEQVWLTGKCKKIRATGKRRQSYVFTFAVVSVVKSTFEENEVSFEIFDDAGKPLRTALQAESVSNSYVEENWRFTNKEILLKFNRLVSDTKRNIHLVDFEMTD